MAAVVRGRRKDLGLAQAQLATLAGVSRKWIYEFEAGKPAAELGLVLRVLQALDLSLDVTSEASGASTAPDAGGATRDLDALLRGLQLAADKTDAALSGTTAPNESDTHREEHRRK